MAKKQGTRRRLSRKQTIALLIVALPLLAYLLPVGWIHFCNARHQRTWDELYAHALATGVPTRPIPDALDLVHFYDESQPYRARNGLTYHMQGFKTSAGEVAIPARFRFCHKEFCEGVAYAVDADGARGFVRPDQSWAFSAEYDYVSSFVNGMARVRNESPSDLITPQIRTGFVNARGELVVDIRYQFARDYVGEFAIASERTVFSPVLDRIMNGVDVGLPLVGWLFPNRWVLLDKSGDRVSPAHVREWIAEDSE